MEEKKHRDSHSFTWGMLVGGALVLMLTTKKGRQILKEISEGGIEGIEEFIDLEKVKELANDFTDDENDEKEEIDDEKQPTPKRKKRRLFRGVRK